MDDTITESGDAERVTELGTTLFEEEDSFIPTLDGVHPIVAIVIGLWYSLIAAGAMSSGFAYLHKGSEGSYWLVQTLMWTVGIGIGVSFGVCLSRSLQRAVGIVCSLALSAILMSLLLLHPSDDDYDLSLSGHRLSVTQILFGIAFATLFFGLVGTSAGKAVRADKVFHESLLGIRRVHWWWLWIALYCWVAIVPTAAYYFWLEIISTGYVLIHPKLWFSDAWTEGWTLTFGLGGIWASLYGIGTSVEMVSARASGGTRTTKRVLMFLLGTLILVGPVANILFRFAINSLEHLPDGISANPWWILR